MTTAAQPKVDVPIDNWIRINFSALHDKCWILNEPVIGKSLIVLAPTFVNNLKNLGKITRVERISARRSFWVITDKFPVANGRYEFGMRVHLVAEAIL